MTWTPINYKLPPIKKRVELKRDTSTGIGRFTGNERLEWISTGSYRYWQDHIRWRLKNTEALTFNNSFPTHWREIKEKKR